MNKIDLQAPTLAGPTLINLGAGTPSCTYTSTQPTIHNQLCRCCTAGDEVRGIEKVKICLLQANQVWMNAITGHICNC